MYYAVYSAGRYVAKLANSRKELEPDFADFRIAEEFSNFADADSYCKALNIALRRNFESIIDEDYYHEMTYLDTIK